MARLMEIRRAVDPKAMKILNDVLAGKLSEEDGAKAVGETIDEFRKAVNFARQQASTGYGANVQKMISFKGTVREMTLQATNRKGGKYPLKVINLYMKPNTERYYEERSYPVDKEAIRKGSPSEGYHPDKAIWSTKQPHGEPMQSRTEPRTETPKKEKSTGFMGDEPIQLRKRRKSIRRLKLRNKKCKCLRKRK